MYHFGNLTDYEITMKSWPTALSLNPYTMHVVVSLFAARCCLCFLLAEHKFVKKTNKKTKRHQIHAALNGQLLVCVGSTNPHVYLCQLWVCVCTCDGQLRVCWVQ